MALFSSIIAGIGAAVGAAGAAYSATQQRKAAKQQNRAAEEQATASRQAEAARKQQMDLDAVRKRRQTIREATVARAQALAAGVNQGAAGSSGLAGGMGQVNSDANAGLSVVAQGQDIGNQLFAANSLYSEAGLRGDRARAQGQAAGAWGSTISSLGGAIMNNAGTISRVGTYAFGSSGYTPTTPAIGQPMRINRYGK